MGSDKKVFNRRRRVSGQLLYNNLLNDFILRKNQEKALEWAKKQLLAGKKFLVLQLPPGSGKSLLTSLFYKTYTDNINPKAKMDVLTCNKALQSQYMDSFPYLENLWGKSNYRCEKHNNNCEYGKQCNTNSGKEPCEDCPHTKAFDRWVDGTMSLTNFHIHGLYSLYNPMIMERRKSQLLIVDEAHSLEKTINGFVSFQLSKKLWSKYVDEKDSDYLEERIFNKKDIIGIVDFICETYKPKLKEELLSLNNSSSRLKGKELEKNVKLVIEIDSHLATIDKFLEDYNMKSSQWVADKKTVKGFLTWDIQPLWTDNILIDNLWQKYNHVIMMSGTIIDPVEFCKLNGINIEDASFLNAESSFPVENRPIYYLPKGKMTFNNKEKAWEDYKEVIIKLLDKYKGKKGIIHCGNFEIWEWIERDIHDKRLIMASPENRQESIDFHLESKLDTVIVSPSMTQGLDLKDDLSRFQIIIKMPYPSLGSKVNKTRFEKNPKWYALATIMELIQAYGRSIRTEDDYADTIILDTCFSDLLRNHENMFPKYFLNAIKKINK